jgi:hypothetical protein
MSNFNAIRLCTKSDRDKARKVKRKRSVFFKTDSDTARSEDDSPSPSDTDSQSNHNDPINPTRTTISTPSIQESPFAKFQILPPSSDDNGSAFIDMRIIRQHFESLEDDSDY